jgi:hypothetical protein
MCSPFRASLRVLRHLPVAFLGVLYLANTAGADLVLNTASWSALGSIYVDSGSTKQINAGDFRQGTGPVEVNGSSNEAMEKRANNGTLLGSGRAFSEAHAEAFTGELHVFLHGVVEAANYPSSPNATNFGSVHIDGTGATARWQDTATVLTPGSPGQTVYTHALIILDGNMSADVTGTPADNRDGQERIQLQLTGPGSPPGPYGGNVFGNYSDNLSGNQVIGPPSVLPIPVLLTMKNGMPYTIDYSMSISATANFFSAAHTAGGARGEFLGNFSQTLRWGGITSITDELGRPIEGWAISSASGFDYSQPAPAPEPSSIALAALGFVGSMAWGWRRRAAARASCSHA